jgi:hypothetical protein
MNEEHHPRREERHRGERANDGRDGALVLAAAKEEDRRDGEDGQQRQRGEAAEDDAAAHALEQGRVVSDAPAGRGLVAVRRHHEVNLWS